MSPRFPAMRRTLVATLFLTLGAGILAAHDLFLKLDSYFVPTESAVRVTVLNGTFAASEAPVAPDRLRDLSLVGPDGRTALPTSAWQPAGDSTVLTFRTGGAGTYVVGASTRPREIQLSAEDFNAYLEHDGIPDVLEARRRSGTLDQPARELYHKHVKAILQAGERRTDGYAVALGYPAELVPLTNPYGLTAGDTLRLRVLVDGNPVARQLVVAGGETAGGEVAAERRFRSDAEGVVAVPLAWAGKWYVKFIHMAPSADPGFDYESKWTTLTFETR